MNLGRKLAVISSAALAVGLWATPAFAYDGGTGATTGNLARVGKVTIDTVDAFNCRVESDGSFRTWQVRPNIPVQAFGLDVTVDDVGYRAKYTDRYGLVTVGPMRPAVYNVGFERGATIAADTTRTFTPTVFVDIPCDASRAELLIGFHLQEDCPDSSSACAYYGARQTFLSTGSPVPAGAVGVFGASAVGAIGLAISSRRRKRGDSLYQGALS